MAVHEFPSWFSRRVAVVLLATFVALSAWALAVGAGSTANTAATIDSTSTTTTSRTDGDVALYQRTIDRVRDGDSYYSAAIDEQQRAGYPTWPPPAVRTPVLTWVHVALGAEGAVWLLRLLVAATVVAAMVRFDKLTSSMAQWAGATLLLVLSLGIYVAPVAASFHDVWAVVLCTLAVLVRRWSVPLAVVLGLAAVGVRELAAPFLVIMFLLAWRPHRREGVAWLVALGLFAGCYALHWAAVSEAVGDLRVDGPSWLSLGGWPFVLDAIRFSSPLRLLPAWVTVLVVPLALLGWLSVRNDVAIRFLAHCATFMVLLSVVGRPNNVYWGTLFVAMLLPGLALTPSAIRALVALLRGADRHRPLTTD